MNEEATTEVVEAAPHDHGGIKCQCGHSDRMHRTGFSKRDAGCMERVGPNRRHSCPCGKTPAAVREPALS